MVDNRSRFSPRRVTTLAASVIGVACISAATTLSIAAEEEGVLTVKKSIENFRDGPDGKKLGSLLEGTRIERISQEGKWVRFRVEGWVWGPSMDGFEEKKAENQAAAAQVQRVPLQDNLPRIKRLINDTHGVFYGVNLDQIAGKLIVRFRVRNIDREDLNRRQMSVQRAVLEILEGEVDFDLIRIETSRPDGSGQVGIEIAETTKENVRRHERDMFAEWKANSRFSTDGGETWTPSPESP